MSFTPGKSEKEAAGIDGGHEHRNKIAFPQTIQKQIQTAHKIANANVNLRATRARDAKFSVYQSLLTFVYALVSAQV
jgi:hypothetical protein